MTDTAGLIAEAQRATAEIKSDYEQVSLVYAKDLITRLAAALAGGGGVNGSDPVAESAASGPNGPSKGTNWGEILRERMWSVATDGWSGDAPACDPDQAANVALDVLCEALNP